MLVQYNKYAEVAKKERTSTVKKWALNRDNALKFIMNDGTLLVHDSDGQLGEEELKEIIEREREKYDDVRRLVEETEAVFEAVEIRKKRLYGEKGEEGEYKKLEERLMELQRQNANLKKNIHYFIQQL